MAQLHNGNLQLIVHDMDTVAANRVDVADFDALDRKQVDLHWEELVQRIESIRSLELREIGLAFCNDLSIRTAYQTAPAGVKTHHAHPGGLLAHVVSLLRLVDAIAPNYPQLDREHVALRVLLHDIGKLEELSFERELTYTDPANLLGHLVQGVQMLDRKVAEVEQKIGKPIAEQSFGDCSI